MQAFPCGGFSSNVVDSSAPLRYGRNDRRFCVGWYKLKCTTSGLAANGGRLPPLHCVVPFNRTGCIRKAPGTAHRPFPTVSLVGGFFTQRISKTGTFVTNNCQLSIVNCQFFLVTPAAGPLLFSFWPRRWPVAVPGFRRTRGRTSPAAGRSSGPAPGWRGFSGLSPRDWW